MAEIVNVIPWLVPAQYCARQGATAYLELWAFLLLLAGCAMLTRKSSRILPGTFALFALLTAAQAGSMFYGCSATAASEQGLGTNLAAGTYKILRCLGRDALGTATGWIFFATLCVAAIVLFVLAIVRWKKAARAYAFFGAAILTLLTIPSGFLLLFGFSWCTSSRLF